MLKKLKRLRLWRNNSGFTLVEVIVASALLGVLLLGVMGFTQPVLQSVATKEQNARAVMLSEAINSYVMGSLKDAYYIQTFSNVGATDAKLVGAATTPLLVTLKYDGSEYPLNANEGLEDMISALDAAHGYFNPDVYMIKAIGVRWVNDNKTGGKKLALTEEVVNQLTGEIDDSKSKVVFSDCFYDGLFPIIKFENYENPYKVDPANPTIPVLASGLKITTDIYLNAECYSTTEGVRKAATLNFTGSGYVDFINIKNPVINAYGYNKIQPNIVANTYNAALTKSSGSTYTDGVDTYYYPNTFIYYIVRRQKTSVVTPP